MDPRVKAFIEKDAGMYDAVNAACAAPGRNPLLPQLRTNNISPARSWPGKILLESPSG